MSELAVVTVDVDSYKLLFTNEGSRFFSSYDDLMSFISDKCGRDVVDSCFQLAGDLYDKLEAFNIFEAQERLESLESATSPVVRRALKNRIIEDYEKLLELYHDLYTTFI